MAIMKMCGKVGCMKHIPHTDTYCNKHTQDKKAYDKKNSGEYDRLRRLEAPENRAFYSSKAWRELRHTVMLKFDYICAACERNGHYTKASVVDHIIEIKDDWDKRLDINNLEPLCHTCHNTKTAREKERRENE